LRSELAMTFTARVPQSGARHQCGATILILWLFASDFRSGGAADTAAQGAW